MSDETATPKTAAPVDDLGLPANGAGDAPPAAPGTTPEPEPAAATPATEPEPKPTAADFIAMRKERRKIASLQADVERRERALAQEAERLSRRLSLSEQLLSDPTSAFSEIAKARGVSVEELVRDMNTGLARAHGPESQIEELKQTVTALQQRLEQDRQRAEAHATAAQQQHAREQYVGFVRAAEDRWPHLAAEDDSTIAAYADTYAQHHYQQTQTAPEWEEIGEALDSYFADVSRLRQERMARIGAKRNPDRGNGAGQAAKPGGTRTLSAETATSPSGQPEMDEGAPDAEIRRMAKQIRFLPPV